MDKADNADNNGDGAKLITEEMTNSTTAATMDPFLQPPSVAYFRHHRPPMLGSSSSSSIPTSEDRSADTVDHAIPSGLADIMDDDNNYNDYSSPPPHLQQPQYASFATD
jgi:hypothetical protein